MVVKVSLYDNSKNQSIVLSNKDITVIGRGFFECQDKRVSKKHGEITVVDSKIKIKSCHQNPIFYKFKNDLKQKVLRKDSEVLLGDSDLFSLLPDEFEWTVKVEQENEPTSTFRIRQTDEINANLTQLLQQDDCETPDLERTPSPENLHPPDDFKSASNEDNLVQTVSSSNRKRSCDNSEDNDNIGIKRMKQVPSSTTSETHQATSSVNVMPQSSDSNSTTTIPLTSIKPDPDSTDITKQQNSSDQNIPSTSAVKAEPIESTDQQPSSSNSDEKIDTSSVKKEENTDNPSCQQSNTRPSCEFGIRCYRMTDDHRREYAHPMDDDYRRPNFPPAPLNAPRCPYWDGCYRRNPEHFREMAHPSSDVYVTQRPPQIQIQIRQIIPAPINQVRSRNHNVRNYIDDEYDEEISDEDMFDDGDDSDVDQDYEIDLSQSQDDEDNEYEENNLEE